MIEITPKNNKEFYDIKFACDATAKDNCRPALQLIKVCNDNKVIGVDGFRTHIAHDITTLDVGYYHPVKILKAKIVLKKVTLDDFCFPGAIFPDVISILPSSSQYMPCCNFKSFDNLNQIVTLIVAAMTISILNQNRKVELIPPCNYISDAIRYFASSDIYVYSNTQTGPCMIDIGHNKSAYIMPVHFNVNLQ